MLIKKLFVDASQAELANLYRNVRIRVHTLSADIHFNKQCLEKEVIPKYVKIQINNNSRAAIKTKKQAEILYIKNMIKQINIKKDNLNFQLYELHLNFEQKYGWFAWKLLFDMVNDEISVIMQDKYNKLKRKLDKLIGYNSEEENLSNEHPFQDRVINLSNVKWNEKETNILNYGLKHNFVIGSKMKTDILATDVETNIRLIRDCDHNEARHNISKSFQNEDNKSSYKQIQDYKECLNIKKKVENKNLVIVKADKSNAIVVLGKDEYIEKTEKFISDNNFKILDRDPTEKFQAELNKVIKKSGKIFSGIHQGSVVMSNPKAPVMKGLPKIHKPNIPIRPLVNYQSAPCYNVSKMLSKTLAKDLDLEFKYNVKNSIDFVEKTQNVNYKDSVRFVSFDITNLYTNVPVYEVVDIINTTLIKKGLEKSYVTQLVNLLKVVLKQNYFRFNNVYYLQENGLAMGSPLSAILSEVFLQHNEEIILENLKKEYEIIMYTRYVDDILIAYNEKTGNEVTSMLQKLNNHHRNLKFTSEIESEGKINYLDLTIKRESHKLSYTIFRKPTQTNTTINASSVHPFSQKTASFRSMLYRAYKIPLTAEDRDKEISIIKSIAVANGYKSSIIDDIGNKVMRKIRNKERMENRTTLLSTTRNQNSEIKKYALFQYNGNDTQRIANKFRKYKISIAFKTSNTLGKIIHPKIENENKFSNSGVYKINCNDCDMFYIGQTFNFSKRYKNHLSAWKNKKPERSNVAKHMLTENHNLGDITENMEIMKFCKKGRNLTAWEDLLIFKDKIKNRSNLINEQVNFDSDVVYRNIFLNKKKVDDVQRNGLHFVSG